MRFANSGLLWLLLLNLPILYLWYKQRRKRILFSSVRRFDLVSDFNLRRFLQCHLVILRVLAFSCLIIALARPQALLGVEQEKAEVIDIIVTIDTSLSMGALDFEKGNRLDVAKEIIDQFITARTGDRLGLISFAAYSQLRSPLTLDHEILKTLLKEVDLVSRTDVEANGTAIGLAIAASVNHLRDSKTKSRIVVLLTDGDNNISTIEPQTAAEIAQVMGIKIYTIGVGKDGMVMMPSRNVKDPSGTFTMQDSSFNENTLKDIAKLTGGNYYRATDRESLAAIFRDIDKLERTTVDVQRYERYQERFNGWLVVSLIALALELILQHSFLRVLP